MSQQHTVTALVQNETGTINRLVSMFRRRGISLASFNAGDCEDPGFSRLTLVVNGNESDLYQTLRQLEKLIDVVEVDDLKPETSVGRELALIRVEPTAEDREKVYALALEFMAKTPAATLEAVVIEVTDTSAAIEQIIAALRPYNVVEVVRTGLVAIRTEK